MRQTEIPHVKNVQRFLARTRQIVNRGWLVWSNVAAFCYAEFATRVPKAGSAYIYRYIDINCYVSAVKKIIAAAVAVVVVVANA